MKKHLFSLNQRDTSSDRLKKFANYFIRDGKKERTEKIMRELLFKIKKEYKVNPSLFLINSLSKIYIPMNLEKTKKGYNPKLIPYWRPRSSSFYQSISPLLKSIKKNREDKIVDRIFGEICRLHRKDNEIVRQAGQMRRDLVKHKGNLRNVR